MANQTTHYPCSGWFFIVGQPNDKMLDCMLKEEIIGYLLPTFTWAGEC